MGKEFFF
jgi:cytochrome oxidase Cu insertion factor (SCO1/SenC/PrrC family)